LTTARLANAVGGLNFRLSFKGALLGASLRLLVIAIVTSLYDRMAKARPANLARADRGDLITLGNLDDDFDKLADCDWIIEECPAGAEAR
jgi:hypothetical protein